MARVTVVVSPRDRFTGTDECVATLRRRTQEPFRLIVQDVGWPAHVRRAVERAMRGLPDARIVAHPRRLPIEALAAVRDGIDTPWTFLLDSDSRVEAGWLPPLLAAAHAGAAVVSPLVLERQRGDRGDGARVHFRVGELRETTARGRSRLLLEHLPERGARVEDVPAEEAASDLFEMHGVLVDTAVLRALELPAMTVREHVDLAIQVRARGDRIVSAPRSVVTFDNLRRRFARCDVAWFRWRWSDDAHTRSEALFEARWGRRFSTEDVLHDWSRRRRAFVVARHLGIPSHAAHRLARAWVRRTGRGADVRDAEPLRASTRVDPADVAATTPSAEPATATR